MELSEQLQREYYDRTVLKVIEYIALFFPAVSFFPEKEFMT